MTPAASVSGLYLAQPEARYFNVGRIGEDQLADWAARQGLAETDARRGGAGVGLSYCSAHFVGHHLSDSAC
jgi:hypothetical protein